MERKDLDADDEPALKKLKTSDDTYKQVTDTNKTIKSAVSIDKDELNDTYEKVVSLMKEQTNPIDNNIETTEVQCIEVTKLLVRKPEVVKLLIETLPENKATIDYFEDFMIRIKIYSSSEREVFLHLFKNNCAENFIHSHWNSFVSVVVKGQFRHTIYGVDSTSETMHMVQPIQGSKQNAREEKGRVIKFNTATYKQGDSYFLDKSALHAVTQTAGNLITVLFKDKTSKRPPTRLQNLQNEDEDEQEEEKFPMDIADKDKVVNYAIEEINKSANSFENSVHRSRYEEEETARDKIFQDLQSFLLPRTIY